MAQPIYSFILPSSQKRYYQIWDTFTGYPETIPMNLTTLLQYKGIHNKEFVGVLFSVFNRLLATGSTINNDSFPGSDSSKEDVFLQQAHIYIEKFEKDNDVEVDDLNKKIEELFLSHISFTDFYEQYINLTTHLSKHPLKPRNYYPSLSHSFICLRKSVNQQGESMFEKLLKSIQVPTNLSLKRGTGITDSLDKWFKQGLFFSHQDFFSSLFVALAKKNLIAFDAIPHILRDNDKVISFFEDLGLQDLLPSNSIKTGFCKKVFKIEVFPFESFAVEYINHAAFHKLGDSALIGLPIFQLTTQQISDKLVDVCLDVSILINFTDENNHKLLPMIYTSYFDLDNEYSLMCLAPFGQQHFHVFSKNGVLIDNNGYYEVYHHNSSVSYFQHLDLINWKRISCHSDNNFKKIKVKLNSLDIENSVIEFEKHFREDNLEQDKNLNTKFLKQPISIQIDKSSTNHYNTSQNDDLPF